MVLIEKFEYLVHQDDVSHVEISVEELLKKFPGHFVKHLIMFYLLQDFKVKGKAETYKPIPLYLHKHKVAFQFQPQKTLFFSNISQ